MDTTLDAAIAKFPSTFGLRAFPGETFRLSRSASYMSGPTPMLYTERLCEDGTWRDFAKGTTEELLRNVVTL